MDAKLSHEVIRLVLTSLVTAVALFAVYRGGMATATNAPAGGPATRAFPDWFLPIWDAYDRNPAVTPEFDFASLYSVDQRTTPARVR